MKEIFLWGRRRDCRGSLMKSRRSQRSRNALLETGSWTSAQNLPFFLPLEKSDPWLHSHLLGLQEAAPFEPHQHCRDPQHQFCWVLFYDELLQEPFHLKMARRHHDRFLPVGKRQAKIWGFFICKARLNFNYQDCNIFLQLQNHFQSEPMSIIIPLELFRWGNPLNQWLHSFPVMVSNALNNLCNVFYWFVNEPKGIENYSLHNMQE